MRIQHNIPSMNSYRNYSANTSAVAKSLEKLSSGYRINRAGDDAAGLAISEKMRAQIAGLEQAQSNAKSGINLVQTAEGAMTEIHDMLNRMVTLAEQSANGTYSDDVDREQLQKEVASLKSEIDRIADSANYNGIKLLDGSLDAVDKVTVNDATIQGIENAMQLQDRKGYRMNNDSEYNGWLNGGTGFVNGQGVEIATAPTTDYRHQNAQTSGKTVFSIDPENNGWQVQQGEVTVRMELYSTPATGGKSDALSLALTKQITINENGTLTQQDAMQQIIDGLPENGVGQKVVYLDMTDKNGNIISGIEYAVSMTDSGEMQFEMTDVGYAKAAANVTDGSDVSLFRGNFNVIVRAFQNSADPGSAYTVDGYAGVDTSVVTTDSSYWAPTASAGANGYIPSDFRTSRGLIFVLAKYGFQPSGVP